MRSFLAQAWWLLAAWVGFVAALSSTPTQAQRCACGPTHCTAAVRDGRGCCPPEACASEPAPSPAPATRPRRRSERSAEPARNARAECGPSTNSLEVGGECVCRFDRTRIDGVCCYPGQRVVRGECTGTATCTAPYRAIGNGCGTEIRTPAQRECFTRGTGCSDLSVALERERSWPLAFVMAVQGCDHGEIVSCNNAGWYLWHGMGTPVDRERGAAYLDRACRANNARACLNLGNLLSSDTPAQDRVRARAAYGRACDLGQPEQMPSACQRYGRMLVEGTGGPADPAAAREAFGRGCQAVSSPYDGNDNDVCANWAYRRASGLGGPAERAPGLAMLRDVCARGHAWSCDRVAELERAAAPAPTPSGPTLPAALARALDRAARWTSRSPSARCANGSAEDCVEAAFEANADDDQAQVLADHLAGCRRGAWLGCRQVSVWLRYQVEDQAALAATVAVETCRAAPPQEWGALTSCSDCADVEAREGDGLVGECSRRAFAAAEAQQDERFLIGDFALGRGTAPDLARATALARAECDAGRGCENLVALLAHDSATDARRIGEAACQRGEESACARGRRPELPARADVLAAIEQYTPALRSCVSAPVTVRVRYYGSSGEVADVRVEPRETRACMRRALWDAQFAPGMRYYYDIDFTVRPD